MTDTIDVPAVRDDALMHTPGPLPITKLDARENRVVNVNEALQPAYQKASTLQLTEDERKTLTAQFPDEAVERRPHDGLLYIPHIEISDRLCQVFGPGQWCTIRRREWIEGTRIYAEWVLLIRGCFIGESVGAMDYHPNNPKMNYSDALEGTRGECIRRISAKELSCGSQVWRPSYCRAWEARNPRGGSRQAPPTVKTPPRATGATPKATPAATGKPFKSKEQLIKLLEPHKAQAVLVLQEAGVLMPNEGLPDWPEDKLPQSPDQLNALLDAIKRRVDGEPASDMEIKPSGEPWRDMLTPFATGDVPKGTRFGDLPKNKLWFWCQKWVPRPYNGVISESDKALRSALNKVDEKYFNDRKKEQPELPPMDPTDDVPF